jgi:transcriptional regulator with XRE-family HTH domain
VFIKNWKILIKKELILELRQERRIKEISQEDIANMAGVHRNYIGKIERMEHEPTIGVVIKIAQALKIKLSKLFKDL